MMRYSLFVSLAFVSLLTMVSAGDKVRLPAKKNFHLYLLAGQSNMAGRGKVAAEDKKAHPRVLALGKDGKWRPAVDPIHFDKRGVGVGPGRSFGIVLAEKDRDIVIGLIPTACGGSPIRTWKPGGYHNQTKSKPYDDALARVKRAQQDGVLKGILWHQGESDSNPKAAAAYLQALKDLVARFRKDLAAPKLPFIVGQLGQFRPWNEARKKVNEAHMTLAKEDPNVVFVRSDGLSCKRDNIHFDAKSQREFGKRYAEAYLKLIK